MRFKGVDVEVGDVVEIRSRAVPLSGFMAAVIAVEGGVLEVLSTFLVPFRHSGLFSPEDVSCVQLVRVAAEAIPIESRGRGFVQGQRVWTTVEGLRQEGSVIAAFDGIVVARRDAGGFPITGGASYFEAVRP